MTNSVSTTGSNRLTNLTRGGGHYIHAEKLRHTNHEAADALARPGRYKSVAGNLRVKEVTVAAGGDRDGARAQRFLVCHNPEAAHRDAAVRERLVQHLSELIDGSDAWTTRQRDEFVGNGLRVERRPFTITRAQQHRQQILARRCAVTGAAG